jgi:hypothetical protein
MGQVQVQPLERIPLGSVKTLRPGTKTIVRLWRLRYFGIIWRYITKSVKLCRSWQKRSWGRRRGSRGRCPRGSCIRVSLLICSDVHGLIAVVISESARNFTPC